MKENLLHRLSRYLLTSKEDEKPEEMFFLISSSTFVKRHSNSSAF